MYNIKHFSYCKLLVAQHQCLLQSYLYVHFKKPQAPGLCENKGAEVQGKMSMLRSTSLSADIRLFSE